MGGGEAEGPTVARAHAAVGLVLDAVLGAVVERGGVLAAAAGEGKGT
jgi:hypothetical protein